LFEPSSQDSFPALEPIPSIIPPGDGRIPTAKPFSPTIVVFIIDLVGNSIGFGNRFLGALMSAIVFALMFGTLVYFGYGNVSMSVTTTPNTTAPAQTQK
jgi:hypothetical protein